MARPLTPLGEFAAEVALALSDDEGVRARAVADARRRFLTRPTAASSWANERGRGRIVGALLALVALAVGWLLFWPTADTLIFTVDGKVGVAHAWIAAPSTRPLNIEFSDGTVLQASSSARVRVVGVKPQGADISVESGQLRARVVHRPQSAWRLSAGPFAIRVTGTRFDVAWDPALQTFSLAVLEGSVVVSGSVVGSERPVRAGEKLLAWVARGRLELVNAEREASDVKTDVERPSPAPSAGAALAVASSTGPPGASAVQTPTFTRQAPAKEAEAWRAFAENGELRQAFGAAEIQGFSGVCASATASELLQLGDGARLSGRSDRATEALLTLRRRYPRDPRRAAAAFSLGKVAFDQQRAYGQAAQWFAICALEQPDGPLAREASGRRIEALRNAGEVSAAERAARDYLARYPRGPHANLARSLITE
ncbi:MAG TPA: FecR domain-containing protein [Polyangiaceae bacterium]|nr:FecR domain-containing protein [Polyangiaceae bacterium]